MAVTQAALCSRCKIQVASIRARQDHICRECFLKNVRYKVIKRMETFRPSSNSHSGQQRRILLPLSCGPSSVSLLHILDQHLKSQLGRSGRASYSLHVLHVEEPHHETSTSAYQAAVARFPQHTFQAIPLASVMLDEKSEQVADDVNGTLAHNNELSLHQLLSSATSITAQVDVLHRLRTRLVIRCARTSKCDAMVWGDSTTRLAEKTMAETAKGRGASIPWLVSESMPASPEAIISHYPMRDVLKKDLSLYSALVEPDLIPLISDDRASGTGPSSALSAKNTTIDSLMNTYFESIEKEYPNIVTNVVRTIGKLGLPNVFNTALDCSLCSAASHPDSVSRSSLCEQCTGLFTAPVT